LIFEDISICYTIEIIIYHKSNKIQFDNTNNSIDFIPLSQSIIFDQGEWNRRVRYHR